ncbi:MAG: transcription antitermination factor NusB [Candidatus Gracilibacteria bacterium]|nr:transcription antitermination factor NusB [Candidatus Gracilibacteria bacterium]
MASSRHQMRISVMQTIFECEFDEKRDAAKVLEYNLENFAEKVDNHDFAKELLKGVYKQLTKIKKLIRKHAPEWPIEQIAAVDRAILYIGVYELVFADHEDVPPVVAINEAIELAKEYAGEKSSKFVNGVLSAIYKDIDNK